MTRQWFFVSNPMIPLIGITEGICCKKVRLYQKNNDKLHVGLMSHWANSIYFNKPNISRYHVMSKENPRLLSTINHCGCLFKGHLILCVKALRWPWGPIVPIISCFFRYAVIYIQNTHAIKEAHVLVSVISFFKVLCTAGCPSLPTLGNNSCSVGVKAGATAPSSASSNLDAPKEVSTSVG